MKPVQFPEANTTWAEDQPEYNPLPAWKDGSESISCWQVSFWERVRVLFTGKVWLRQLHFGQPLQPVRLDTEHPFEVVDE